MKKDIILSGVGGQGILSIATVIPMKLTMNTRAKIMMTTIQTGLMITTTKVITNLLITGIEIMKRYKYMQRREQKQQICLIDFAGLHLIFIKENLMEGVG